MSPVSVALMSLGGVLLLMLVEMAISRRHEIALRARGAVEPSDDVYRAMRWAYPLSFVVMAAEGGLFGPTPGPVTAAGAGLMLVSKALKFWAMASLGTRWTFRVLVVPGPLVTRGPYAWMPHPNYLAVAGEFVSMALLVGARITGPLTTVLFSLLMWKRIRIEERALRHFTCS